MTKKTRKARLRANANDGNRFPADWILAKAGVFNKICLGKATATHEAASPSRRVHRKDCLAPWLFLLLDRWRKAENNWDCGALNLFAEGKMDVDTLPCDAIFGDSRRE